MPGVECPKCGTLRWVDPEGIGQRTECQACHAEFPAVSMALEPVPTDNTTAIARFIADIYEPADGAERAWIIREAQWMVRKPAHGLICTGLIGITITLMIALVAFVDLAGKPNLKSASVFTSVGASIAATFYFFLIAAGGYQLKRLQNRPFCIFAAILGITGMACCGIYAILSVTGFIFGTWALVAMNNPAVRHAMEWLRRDKEESRQLR